MSPRPPSTAQTRHAGASTNVGQQQWHVQHLIDQWRTAALSPNAQLALTEHPEWAAQKSIVLDLAMEEYCLRTERGEAVEIGDYAQAFGDHAASVIHLLEVQRCFSSMGITRRETSPWPECGDEIGKFRLIEELGRGAFARVFLAEQEKLSHRRVVVKLSQLGGREAEIMARCEHPHIVPIYSADKDTDSGFTVICMPYLGRTTGFDLLQRYKRGYGGRGRAARQRSVLPIRQFCTDTVSLAGMSARLSYTDFVVSRLADIAEALSTTHRLGICHGDLKPSNILITNRGHAQLLDFNLSFANTDDYRWGGTAPYMAPELLTPHDPGREQHPTPRSDLFSLGVVVYEMLGGQLPFDPPPQAANTQDYYTAIYRSRQTRPTPLCELNSALDRPLAELVGQCLEFSPAQRPPDAAQVAARLRDYLATRRKVARWAGRWRRGLIAASLSAVLLLGGVGYGLATRPSYAERQMATARDQYRDGELQAAGEIIQRVLDINPLLPDAWFLRGRLQERAADYDGAAASFARAAQLQPAAKPLLLALQGYCAARLARHPIAIEYFQTACNAQPKVAAYWNDLGYCHLQLRNYDAALAALDRAIAADPHLVSAYHSRINLHLSRYGGSGVPLPPQTLADVGTALSLAEPTADLLHDAALVYLITATPANDHKAQAINCLRQAIELGLPEKTWSSHPLLAALKPDVAQARFQGQQPRRADRLLDPISIGESALPAFNGG